MTLSKIYTGQLMHTRLEPVKYRFDYPVYFYSFDLDELETLGRANPFFGHNRFNLVSLYDNDYLDRGPGALREKLRRYLAPEGLDEAVKKVELVTCARFLGYIFNPASFFYCYTETGSLACVVAQVNNTFGETHIYLTREPLPAKDGLARYAADKAFHVSPFFDRKGEYEFKYSPVSDTIEIQVNLKKDGRYVLVSQMTGRARPVTGANILKTVLAYPLTAVMTIPRIHWQAAKLYFGKKLPVYKKPAPSSPMTVRTPLPKLRRKAAFKIFDLFLSRARQGHLRVQLPDGSVHSYGDTSLPARAEIRVHDDGFFWRVIRDSGIGLGESYMDGQWETPDLTAVLEFLIDNKSHLSPKVSFLEGLGAALNRLYHLARRNTVSGSRKNIQDHYDLSNDFFQVFLDESMTYSAGFYKDSYDTLYAAQQNKLQRMIEKARITSKDHVLEIGCGWGSFAIKAARETGCRVTGITLSKEQLMLATQRVREAGLSEKITLELCDYRNMKGQFDRIISIEMLEAVGHEYLEGFFQALDRLLKPEGVAVIQSITIPDQRYDSYRKGCDWIQKHIFPGGHLPSLTAVCKAMTQSSTLFVENVENIGVHYARTLREWKKKFREQQARIEALGFDERFRRKWEYYFSYCEAGFSKRYLNDIQMILTRAGNKTLDRKGEPSYAESFRAI
ncbi:MAG TPA: DUF1365 family protein [Verrucomicrobiae bacterium]|nr:DUF1365 family protein [Verrucomicrobiae bacterium]